MSAEDLFSGVGMQQKEYMDRFEHGTIITDKP